MPSFLAGCATWAGAVGIVSAAAAAQEVPWHAGAVVRFATVEEGAALLGREDAFTRAASRFDRQARLKTGEAVGTDALLAFAARQVEPWSQAEIEAIAERLASLAERLKPFPPLFPGTILLIKTTGEEEGGAAYCRQQAIVLPQPMLRRPPEALERLLAHELFHLLSRHDPARQQRLYAVVGFRPCGEIELPPALRDRKITNPDAPLLDYRLELRGAEGVISATPFLLATVASYPPAEGKSFFHYMQFRLLQLTAEGDRWRAAVDARGEPILLDPKTTASYHDQIGRNTTYIIHPEEVLAENFVHLLFGTGNLPSPQVVQGLEKVLREAPP